jgi:endoglucanase
MQINTRQMNVMPIKRWIFSAQILLLVSAPFLPEAALAQGAGYWHTSGNQILDSNNTPVRVAGLNWYGFETTDFIAHGLWAQDYKSILETVKAQGYNTIRIPFSNQMVESNPVPTNLSFYNTQPINTDLQGQTSLVILDKIVSYCGQIGVRVILDNHRSEAGNSAEDNGLWYTSAYPESNWISDWVQLASRYNGNTTVIGFDLRNEPHNSASWGDNNAATDWRAAAERAGNAVLGVNPNLLIFVEGIQNYNNNYYWWGGNLEGAGQYPVQLSMANRVVYSAHDYGPDLSGQSWFNGSTTTASLNSVWTSYWAYLSIDNIAPVWLGEFGTTNNSADIAGTSPGSQGQWFQSMIQFLAAHPAIDWTYWALNGEDEFGLLDTKYDSIPASAQKQQALASIQFALSGSGGGMPDFTIGITPASQTVTAGSSATYTVTLAASNGFSGAVNLAASGLPPGVSAAFSSSQVNLPATAILTLAASSSVTPGSYVVTVTGTAGTLTHSSAAYIVVQAAPVPDFSLSASPGAQSVTAGSQVNWTISSAPQNGFAGSVGLSVGGLPMGAEAIFTPASISGAGNSSLTINSTSQTAAGSYQLTVTGTSGSLQHSLPLTLNVSPAKGDGGCTVTWQVYSDWGAGFVVGLILQNNTGVAISNWTLGWTFSGNQQITNLWNGELTQAGEAVTVANAPYNGSIGNGGNTQLGFQAAYSGSNLKPSVISMNGTSCVVQ